MRSPSEWEKTIERIIGWDDVVRFPEPNKAFIPPISINNIVKSATTTSSAPIKPPEPVQRKITTSFEIEESDFRVLPAGPKMTMLRNAVKADSEFTTADIEWCHNNCTDLWMISDDYKTIRFLSSDDKTMFILAKA